MAAQPAVQPNTPPLGLDGFCPVTLVERSRTAPEDPRCWTRGDPAVGRLQCIAVITYLFLGPEEQKRFLQEPDRFAPALSGNDSVLAFDRGQLVRGHREFGIFFENRIYLFANAETLERFQQNPRRYADEVRQAENPQHSSRHSPDYSWPKGNPKRKRGRRCHLPSLTRRVTVLRTDVNFLGRE